MTDLRLEETEIPTPASGQLLLAVQYLSLDPYMRGRMDDRKSYAKPLQLGDVMTGELVARVLASNHPGYAEGDIFVAVTGWRTHALSHGTGLYGTALRKLDPAVAPVTTALGVLGMPGFTAYGGLRSIGKPQPGETVVAAAASGPVGSLVGQLAKLAGARAVGIAGGPEKCAFVKDELRFDAAVEDPDDGDTGGCSSAAKRASAHYERNTSWRQTELAEPKRSGPCPGDRQDAAGNHRRMQRCSPEPCRRGDCAAQARWPH